MRLTISELDCIRVALIVIASICMLLMALRARRARRVNGDRFAVRATAALLMAMVFVVIVEANQFGDRLKTWWGLPMLAVISLLTLSALWSSKV